MNGRGGTRTPPIPETRVVHPTREVPSTHEVPSRLSGEGRGRGIGVLLVGHGSRRGGANRRFEALVSAFGDRQPDVTTAYGYVELAKPGLDDALDRLARTVHEVVAVPAFLFLAGHVKNDLPLALDRARTRHPDVRFALAPPLGVDVGLCELAWTRAEEALSSALPTDDPAERERTACLLVGRGSSDPDANGDFVKVARLMSEFRSLVRVEPCFLGITGPTVAEGLALLARLRPSRIVVLPYLLFAGRLMERLEDATRDFAARHPWIEVMTARTLEADPVVLDLLAERARAALQGTGALPCDTCQFRTPLPGRALQAGGLRALLWSMRHTYTHTQAMPAEHAHPPIEKHVFVCTNADCADRGAGALLRQLRTEVKAKGLSRRVRVTKTSCMGRCGEGPSVAVYPDGIWYRNVMAADAAELVEDHFMRDRLVARLVDNILQ